MSQLETEQQKRRALKAQKARQAAIESLKLKREERKQEVKKIAEQEMVHDTVEEIIYEVI